jgi:hypothetical protein
MGRSSFPVEVDHYLSTTSGCVDDLGWGPIHVSKLPRTCLQHLLLQHLDCLMSFWHLEKTCMALWPACWLVLSCAVAAVFLLGAESDNLFSLKNGIVMKGLKEGVSQSTCTASWNQKDILYWKYIPLFVRVLLVAINHEQWHYGSLVGDTNILQESAASIFRADQ